MDCCGNYGKSLLSREDIIAARSANEVVIEPFCNANVGTNSYDVTLGPFFWKERHPDRREGNHRVAGGFLYNFYDETHVKSLWQLCEAKPASQVVLRWEQLIGIEPEDRVILLEPGEVVLGHTIEFIGGKANNITTMMKARSTIGRNFIEVARCAGMGDIGYCNRWTLEITNNSRYHVVPLVVGRRIGQVVFFETTPVKDDYLKTGKYQADTDSVTQMMDSWSPEDMLPKAYKDREIKETVK